MIKIPGFMLTAFSYQRQTAGGYVAGKWVSGTPATAENTEGAVQPLAADEVQLLPEGQRNRKSIKIYTNTELKAVQEKNKIKGDIVTVDSENYEVQRVFYQRTDFFHYKALCTKVDYQ